MLGCDNDCGLTISLPKKIVKRVKVRLEGNFSSFFFLRYFFEEKYSNYTKMSWHPNLILNCLLRTNIPGEPGLDYPIHNIVQVGLTLVWIYSCGHSDGCYRRLHLPAMAKNLEDTTLTLRWTARPIISVWWYALWWSTSED